MFRCPWDSPGKDTGVGCHALLQGIFLNQGLNLNLLRLLRWQVGSWPLAPPQHIWPETSLRAVAQDNLWSIQLSSPEPKEEPLLVMCRHNNIFPRKLVCTETLWVLPRGNGLLTCLELPPGISMCWKTLKRMWPPGLSQPFPMLLNQSASPSSACTGAAETTHTVSSREELKMLPPSWGVHFWAVVNKQAPGPCNLGSDLGFDTLCVGLFKTWII